MMNRTLIFLMLGASVAVCSVARCESRGPLRKITLEVRDETGAAVADANANIYFWHPGRKRSPVHKGETDANGRFSAMDRVLGGVEAKSSKSGYYSIKYHRVQKDRMDDSAEPIHKKILMRSIINPTALYARKVTLTFPKNGVFIGFDFGVGDWVSPYGKGVKTDILFKSTRVFEGYSKSERKLNDLRQYTKGLRADEGKEWSEEYFREVAGNWGGLLEISFTEKKEGIQICDDEYYVESDLRMPHEAPLDGYQANWDSKVLQRQYKEAGKPDLGFFVRTRVELNRAGKIESANYVKFNESLSFDPKKNTVSFQYHFNPAANDLNLEFDPKRNLFQGLDRSESVYNP
ncbi:hypothetical protein [Rubritalea tangerina]|uniref:Carboxypeptidase regulatory-like domain-containing protein n=1 Tax=Rubritalea tangerina TaxID=430798 RepID=A0ABW4ZBS2_9BACT